MQPLINILIRTSNRPLKFINCLQSIQRQEYKNIRILVSYDTDTRPDYIPQDIEAIHVGCPHDTPAYYNLYCNDLKARVDDGYFFFLDDDDQLNSEPRTLHKLSKHLHQNCLTIVQFRRGHKRKPMGKQLVAGKIGMPCIVVHHSHKHKADLEGQTWSDFTYIKAMTDRLPWKFLPLVLVEASERGMGVMV